MRVLVFIIAGAATVGCRPRSVPTEPRAPTTVVEPKAEAEPVTGEPEDFILPLADGRTVSVAEFRGRPVVIELASGQVASSDDATSAIQALVDAHPELVVFRVSLDPTLDPSVAARAGAPQSTRVAMWVHDPQGALAARLQLQTIPSFIVLDARGVEVARVPGGRPDTGQGLAEALRRALEQPAH